MSTAVSETRVARSASRVLALPEKARERPWLAIAAVMGLGAVVFLAGLGRSSLFMDEVFSWNAAHGDWQNMGDALRGAEIAPPLYYVLLHLWLELAGTSSETVLRLPSALAGVGFVASVFWLGTAVADRRVGLTAGVLAALSPLALQYAQEARAYIFVMLAVTLAAAAVVRLSQEPERRRWLVVAATASATAMLLHYTALLVLFPICVWLLCQRQVSWGIRLAVGAAAVAPLLALAPLAIEQMAAGHHSATTDAYARITNIGLLRLVSTPFDGRATGGVTLSWELGFLALVDAIALLALADRFRHQRARWLLIGASVLPVAAVIAVSALVHPAAISRYTTIATPFMLVTIAVVVWRMHSVLGIGLGVVALAAALLGIGAAQTPGGQFPDMRSALRYTGDAWRPGDVIVGLNQMAFGGASEYYEERELPAGATGTRGYFSTQEAFEAPATRSALARGKRVWVVAWPPVSTTELDAAAAAQGAELRGQRKFPGAQTMQVSQVRAVR